MSQVASEQQNPLDITQHPALSEVYRLCDEIEDLEEWILQAKEQLYGAVLELPAKIGDNEDLRDEIVHQLYWFEDRVPAKALKQAFQVVSPSHAGKRGNTLHSPIIEMPCSDCNQLHNVTFSSRSRLQEKERWAGRCDQCEAKFSQTHHQWYREYQQQQTARQERLTELRYMPYYDYLKTEEWQERRKRALKHAGFRCQVCNAYGVRLNVHHRTYERRGNEQDRDLITLCAGCHSIFHENGKLAKDGVE